MKRPYGLGSCQPSQDEATSVMQKDAFLHFHGARDGGLGIPIPTEAATEQYRASRSITNPLVALCTGQNTEPLPNTYIVQEELKGETKKHR